MSIPPALVALATSLVAQVDPAQGTATARQGAIQRLSEPNYYDIVFPGIAFLLVIVLPVSTALWVIYRTVTEKQPEPDER